MSEKRIRTALLTTGSGLLSKKAFDTLRGFSNLQGVVFSRRKRPVSRFRRIGEYGLWYTSQMIFSHLLGILTNTNIQEPIKDLPTIVWATRQDETTVLSQLNSWEVDVVFVCSFQHILQPVFLTNFKTCINIHPSLLPAYRGPEPIVWGLLEGASTYGLTLHLVDEGIDTGAIVCQAEVNHSLIPLIYLVEQKLAATLPQLIKQTLRKLAQGTLDVHQQNGGFYKPVPTLANRRR